MNKEAGRPGLTRRELEEMSIQIALEGDWEEAEHLNRLLLEREPDNVDALNRLGKALLEQGQYAEAQAAYNRTLELDPYNRIAHKNRIRLEGMLQRKRTKGKPGKRKQIRPDLFISESGKSAVVPLRGSLDPDILPYLSRGDIVRLEPTGEVVLVQTDEGTPLGRLDPRVVRRLAEFIGLGNRYTAAIAEVNATGIKVFVRETRQIARLVGRLSFPPLGQSQTEIVRPYVQDWGLHLDETLEEELEEEEEAEESDLEEEDEIEAEYDEEEMEE